MATGRCRPMAGDSDLARRASLVRREGVGPHGLNRLRVGSVPDAGAKPA